MSILRKQKTKVIITKDNFKNETFSIWKYKKSIPFTTMVKNDGSFNFNNISKIIKSEEKGSFEKIHENPESLIYLNLKSKTLVRISQHWSDSINSLDKKGKDIKRVDVNMSEGLVFWVLDYGDGDMGINQWKFAVSKLETFKNLEVVPGNIINGLGDMVEKTFYEIDGETISQVIDNYLESN